MEHNVLVNCPIKLEKVLLGAQVSTRSGTFVVDRHWPVFSERIKLPNARALLRPSVREQARSVASAAGRQLRSHCSRAQPIVMQSGGQRAAQSVCLARINNIR